MSEIKVEKERVIERGREREREREGRGERDTHYHTQRKKGRQ